MLGCKSVPTSLLPHALRLWKGEPRRRGNSHIALQHPCALPLQTLVELRLNFCLHFHT